MEVGDPRKLEEQAAGHPTYHVNGIKLKWEIMWTGGLPTKAGYLTYHLHVNRPLDFSFIVLNILAD